MKKRNVMKYLTPVIAAGLLLSACSSSSGGSSKNTAAPAKKENINTFPMDVKNTKSAIADGTLNYGEVSDTPFEGTLDWTYYEGQPDADILQFFSEALFATDANYRFTNNGAATYKMSDDNKTITVKIKDNVNWSDGQPVTADDYKYSFMVIGNKDYTGVRYGDAIIQSIVGMDAYHSGKATDISGIKIIDNKTLSITFTKVNPSLLTGLWPYAMPKHYLGNIPIKDLGKSDAVHKNPIGFGPFKVSKIIPGESVEFVRNDNYWKGKPKLKSIVFKVVNPNVVLQSLKKGDIDVASYPADQYEAAKGSKNFQFLGKIDLSYSYIGFKLGHWDAKNSVNVMDNPKFKDKRLREAMGYALDEKSVGDKIYNGLRFPATSLIPPSFPIFYDPKADPVTYDPAKAKKLLDEAGYKDVNGDGFREDPNGKPFVVNFLAMSGGATAEPLANFYIQCWKNVGINVKLVDGRLAEFNSFYKMVEADDPKVDIFGGAWGTGTDPDPYGLYSKTANFNFSRFVDDKNEQLLADGESDKAMDVNYRKKVYSDWQKYMNDQMPVIPTLFRDSLTAVNNRVTGLTVDPAKSDIGWDQVGVSSNTPDVQ